MNLQKYPLNKPYAAFVFDFRFILQMNFMRIDISYQSLLRAIPLIPLQSAAHTDPWFKRKGLISLRGLISLKGANRVIVSF